MGNRLRKNATSYTYDRADRITAAGAVSYTVDANGNITARGSDSFSYDQANRLKTVTINGASSSYTYDGDGKRARKTVGGVTTSFVYDVASALPNVLTDGTRTYVYGLGLAYTVDSSGKLEVAHPDGLGSVRALTDGSGTVVHTYQTDPFGEPTQSSGSSPQPFEFIGQHGIRLSGPERRCCRSGFSTFDAMEGRSMLDESALRKQLSQLPPKHRVAFCAACCERLLPNYEAFLRSWSTG